jgi:magnesium chelatase family protein
MNSRQIRETCALGEPESAVLQKAVTALHLSARAYDRILKVARTIADLEERDRIASHHLQEAIGYRALDREIWK